MRGLCPPEGNGGRVNSPQLFPKYWALRSEGDWAGGAGITLSALSRWSCGAFSKYNEVYCLPKFCSIWCFLQPRIFANEFLMTSGFYKMNYITFGTISRKISLRTKAPSNDLIPSSHKVGWSAISYWRGYPRFQCLFRLR